MVTLTEFESLSEHDREVITFSLGDYISTRNYYGYRINLYVITNFLVEAWYCHEDNSIDKIELLKSNKPFNQYAQQVNLESLF
ncbi:MAG: hypothetical protein ACJA2S_004561 [Cyclobacteriaceae bacterium]|jgi:hypothetical protein